MFVSLLSWHGYNFKTAWLDGLKSHCILIWIKLLIWHTLGGIILVAVTLQVLLGDVTISHFASSMFISGASLIHIILCEVSLESLVSMLYIFSFSSNFFFISICSRTSFFFQYWNLYSPLHALYLAFTSLLLSWILKKNKNVNKMYIKTKCCPLLSFDF